MRHTVIAGLVVLASPLARADVTRCADVDADLAYMATDLADQSGDTGWFPGGSPAQLRITGQLVGQTTVGMGLSPTACWTNGMTLTAPARAQAGMLDAEYGAQVHVYGQIHTSVLGESIDWSGEIPVPFTDFLLADTTPFDGTLLPDGKASSASASDTTSRIPLITTDVIGDLIDIVGISGGLQVYVQGEMTSTYSTQAISLDGGQITSTTGSIAVETPPNGFGPSLTVALSAAGDIVYQPALVFGVSFVVKILGITVANFDIASVQLPLPSVDRSMTLAGDNVTIPLPHLDAVPVSLGFAGGSTAELQLHNSGLAPLMLEVATAPAGVTADALTIAPGADGAMTITGTPPAGSSLVFATNDPNLGTLTIGLDPMSSGQTSGSDDGSDDATHAGCNATHNSGWLLVLAAIGLLLRRRAAPMSMRRTIPARAVPRR